MNKDKFDNIIVELFKYRDYNFPLIKNYRLADCYGIVIDCYHKDSYEGGKDDPEIWAIYLHFQYNPFYTLDPQKFYDEYLYPALRDAGISFIPLHHGVYTNIKLV